MGAAVVEGIPPPQDHGDWINQQRLKRGLRWSEVGKAMERFHGVSVTTDYLYKLRRGAAPLANASLEVREALRNVLGISEDDWYAGTGLYTPGYTPTPPKTPQTLRVGLNEQREIVSQTQNFSSVLYLEYTMKPVYDLAQASRPLSEADALMDIPAAFVPNTELRTGTELFKVRGSSMALNGGGGIQPNDVVYADTHDTTPRPNGVYVIYISGGGTCIKRVRELGGQLWLFSDNPDQAIYPPFQADEARIIGRVHKIVRDVQVAL